ncbi:histidine kinase, partial [Acinetobacter bereziniae]
YYSSQPISIAIGYATTNENESIDNMLKSADLLMYQKKKNYYEYVTEMLNEQNLI